MVLDTAAPSLSCPKSIFCAYTFLGLLSTLKGHFMVMKTLADIRKTVSAKTVVAGSIFAFNVDVPTVVELFTNTNTIYNGQRDHGKNFRKRKHVQGLLFGASQCFTAAYCLENKKLLALDGYHRAYGLAKGQSYFLPGATIQLSVLVVNSMEQVRNVYDQYDSPDARKKISLLF
jgi:hypothetical protein